MPGVPAAVGVPAYAGIPVTYPGGGDTVTFVRGHEDEGRERRARSTGRRWRKLEGTIVSLRRPAAAVRR